MQKRVIGLAFVALVGCTQAPNDSYTSQMDDRLRDAQLQGLPAPQQVSEQPLDMGPVISQEQTATPTIADAPAVGSATFNNPGLSDEQSFDAVSDRQTIESDAERLERNRALYTVIEPTAVPRRPGSQIPNIVAYALQTNNPLGEPLYKRGIFATQARFDRNCAKFTSDAAAQEAFLAAGGPEKDGRGLDPDGDGYACYWDPRPFRRAIQSSQPRSE